MCVVYFHLTRRRPRASFVRIRVRRGQALCPGDVRRGLVGELSPHPQVLQRPVKRRPGTPSRRCRGPPRRSRGSSASLRDWTRTPAAVVDGLRDGLFVFFVGVVLFCVAAAVYLLADLLVAAAPVVMLASFVAVPRLTSNASRRGVGQWGGAGGASCEDHLAFCGELLGFARRLDSA